MERAMKVQDVILQAMAKKITWYQAAEIIGISDRHMRRWRERYEEGGFRGLFDRRRGKPSPKRVPMAVVERVLELYREKYFDLNLSHFHEKLASEHQIGLSYSWVKGVLQGAGLVARGRKRGVHRKRRERRPLPGMLLHIDGSRHRAGNWEEAWLMPRFAKTKEFIEFSISCRSARPAAPHCCRCAKSSGLSWYQSIEVWKAHSSSRHYQSTFGQMRSRRESVRSPGSLNLVAGACF